MGGTVFPPYSLASGQGYGKGKSSIGDLLQKDLGQQATSSRTVVISASDPAAGQATLSTSNSRSLLKLISIESVMPPNHLTLCHPHSPQDSIFPGMGLFQCVGSSNRGPKNWSFSFIISPSNEYSGLISFRMDWLDLLAVQGTLKSLQHHSSKASILRCSDFFMVQLSHPYITTRKTIALIRWAFGGKVMSLLIHMLSRLVIAFLLSL